MTAAEGGQDLVMDKIGVEPIIKVIVGHPGSEGVQGEALGVLRDLVKGRADIQGEVAKGGGAEAILQAMRSHPSSASIIKDAIWVLQQLTMIEPGRRRIALRGGIDDIDRALKDHPMQVDIQEAGCSALGNLCFDEGVRTQIGKDSISVVLNAMNTHPDDEGVQEGGAFVIHNLACDHEIARVIKSLGGLDALERALAKHPANTPEEDERVVALQLLQALD